MIALSIIVRICIWVQDFRNWRILKCLWAPLSCDLWIVAKLLCSCLCLYDTVVGLHGMDEKNMVQCFSHWKVNVIEDY